MRLLASGLSLLCAGCLTPGPGVRLEKPTPIAVAYVLDDIHQKRAQAVPSALSERVEAALMERNLVPRPIPVDAYLDAFATLRDSKRRLQRLASAATGADQVLLVETRARFYSQISGRYRWTVYVKLSVARLDDLGGALVEEVDIPSLLFFDHEKAPEAVAEVAAVIGRRVGALVDGFLGAVEATLPSVEEPPPVGATPGPAADSIYFVLVDRFHNGDSTNDGEVDPQDPIAWHGGDLQGVIDKLDYLQDLGIRTLWLSPIFAGRHRSFEGHGAFHGYWVRDLTRLDPRFGDVALLGRLAQALHRRGMRLVLDWVVNHVAFDAPLVQERPDWFHQRGSISDWNDPAQMETHDVHGLPDLAQENDEVYRHLLSAARTWISAIGVDGLRLDAVKHVPSRFWSRYNRALKEEHPGLVLLGELYDGAPQVTARVAREGAFTHMFDFPLAFALRDVFGKGESPGKIGAVLWADGAYEDPTRLVTFLDNHDVARILSVCGGDFGRVQNALTAQLAMRGIPAITYGTEAGLAGEEEPENRGDMRFDPPEAAALKARVRRMLALRAGVKALRSGTTRLLSFTGETLSFARIEADTAALVAIGGRVQSPVPIPGWLRDGGHRLRDGLSEQPLDDFAIDVGPGETRVIIAEAAEAGGFAPMMEPRRESREVHLAVAPVALEEGEALLVVGSGPQLGDWSIDRAPELGRTEGGFAGTLELPVGSLFAFKLVARAAKSAARWETGDDRYLFVEVGEGPKQVTLAWRPG